MDGTYGVIASVIAARELRQRLAAPAMNLAVVAWTNEEGCSLPAERARLAGLCGHDRHRLGAGQDRPGRHHRQAALEAIGHLGTDQPAPRPAAYVELHIECGPLLERAGRRLAAFDRWWGCRKLEIRFEGVPAHTGPTPMAERKDALLAAAGVITELRQLVDMAPPGELHTSVGRIEALPNSPNVVPSTVTIFAELRPPIRPCWRPPSPGPRR
ncbi:MAG: M20/M25/M40 family metallo-hydrolase [Geminicoccaceae bacterium]